VGGGASPANYPEVILTHEEITMSQQIDFAAALDAVEQLGPDA